MGRKCKAIFIEKILIATSQRWSKISVLKIDDSWSEYIEEECRSKLLLDESTIPFLRCVGAHYLCMLLGKPFCDVWSVYLCVGMSVPQCLSVFVSMCVCQQCNLSLTWALSRIPAFIGNQ